MIRSMTGYGRAEFANEDLKITVEIKSVNNRYLDIGIKMPRQLGMLESSIRAELKKYIGRGKVDVYITYEDLQEANMQVKYNSKIAGEYLRYLRQMAEEYGLDNDIRVSSLSKYPDVFTMACSCGRACARLCARRRRTSCRPGPGRENSSGTT